MSKTSRENKDSGEHGSSTRRHQEQISQDIRNLCFPIRLSIRYHTKRRRFFENLHHLSTSLTAISGSSAFMAMLGNQAFIATILIGFAAFLSILNSAIDFAGKRTLYHDLQFKFSSLLMEIIKGEETEENLKQWEAARIEIEKDEPTILKVLNLICHNEEAVSQNKPDHICKIPYVKSLFSQLISFDSTEIVRAN